MLSALLSRFSSLPDTDVTPAAPVAASPSSSNSKKIKTAAVSGGSSSSVLPPVPSLRPQTFDFHDVEDSSDESITVKTLLAICSSGSVLVNQVANVRFWAQTGHIACSMTFLCVALSRRAIKSKLNDVCFCLFVPVFTRLVWRALFKLRTSSASGM